MDEAAPTMIIPRGTRIEMDPDGQISIHAPGNVVVQNSGKYGTLESLGGSIRIDRGVEVEASTIRCAQTCFVQGFLTAWKVSARSLHLEDGAGLHPLMQVARAMSLDMIQVEHRPLAFAAVAEAVGEEEVKNLISPVGGAGSYSPAGFQVYKFKRARRLRFNSRLHARREQRTCRF